ncbi:hypothetical protein [Paraburkholderia sp. DGU8]|uniref:hypothetical protein n=1 Tax=Paraburkholderia sp. DGU8 TaxID=3161997 RepID=UPI0034653634
MREQKREEWQSIRARREAGDDLVLTRIEPPVAALTPESYTVRKLCEDFVTDHIERHRDALCASHFRSAHHDKDRRDCTLASRVDYAKTGARVAR